MTYEATNGQATSLSQNEQAATALMSLLGGVSGLSARPKGTYMKVAEVLGAAPDDDLSGLRLLAERMTHTSSYAQGVLGRAPKISGDMARGFLLRTNRAILNQEGNLIMQDPVDHLGYAALVISQIDESTDLYEAYTEVTEARAPLSGGIVGDIAHNIASRDGGGF